MDNERYIAALDISSSKITGVVGVLRQGGHIDIIAAEQEHHTEAVRYGHIQNLEDTSRRIGRVIEMLENNPAVSPRKITGVFVGLNGISMRSINTDVTLSLPDDTEITTEILERLRRQALETAIDNTLEVVDAVDRTYRVGKTETHNPKGAVGSSISASFDLVVCRPSLRRNVERTVADKLHLRCDFMVTALATGLVVLPEEDKRLGCMLVDMGAETTTVTIYRKGFLVYLATIPLGGRNITRDLTRLNLLEEKAEEIKTTHGNAMPVSNVNNLNLGGVRLGDVSQIVVARSEELVANILEQITYAGLTEKDIPGGIVLIGGGAKLLGIPELLKSQSGLDVRTGQLPAYVRIESPKISGFDLIQAVSVLYAGADLTDKVCLEMPSAPELPSEEGYEEEDEDQGFKPKRKGKDKGKDGDKKPKGRGFWGKLSDTMGKMFVPKDDDEEDSDLY